MKVRRARSTFSLFIVVLKRLSCWIYFRKDFKLVNNAYTCNMPEMIWRISPCAIYGFSKKTHAVCKLSVLL